MKQSFSDILKRNKNQMKTKKKKRKDKRATTM